jgi:hypothetical protein
MNDFALTERFSNRVARFVRFRKSTTAGWSEARLIEPHRNTATHGSCEPWVDMGEKAVVTYRASERVAV